MTKEDLVFILKASKDWDDTFYTEEEEGYYVYEHSNTFLYKDEVPMRVSDSKIILSREGTFHFTTSTGFSFEMDISTLEMDVTSETSITISGPYFKMKVENLKYFPF